jgi:hypothetical protein
VTCTRSGRTSLGSARSTSASSAPASRLPGRSRTTRSASASSQSTGPTPRGTTMPPRSTRPGSGQLTLLQEGSPASPSPRRGNGSRRRTSAGSGPTWPTPFAFYDPASSSWRTSVDSSAEGSRSLSATWPPSGTTACGAAYRLPPWAPPTSATGSSWWPSPSASDYKGVSQPGQRRSQLLERVLWPTPKASDGDKAGRPRADHRGDLQAVVRMWPTPQARDGQGRSPQAQRWGDPSRHGGWNLDDRVAAEQETGTLNPEWVEQLMGLPRGWTDIGGPLPRARRSTAGRRRGRSVAATPSPTAPIG